MLEFKRINSYILSSDFYMSTVAFASAHVHVYMCAHTQMNKWGSVCMCVYKILESNMVVHSFNSKTWEAKESEFKTFLVYVLSS